MKTVYDKNFICSALVAMFHIDQLIHEIHSQSTARRISFLGSIFFFVGGGEGGLGHIQSSQGLFLALWSGITPGSVWVSAMGCCELYPGEPHAKQTSIVLLKPSWLQLYFTGLQNFIIFTIYVTCSYATTDAIIPTNLDPQFSHSPYNKPCLHSIFVGYHDLSR